MTTLFDYTFNGDIPTLTVDLGQYGTGVVTQAAGNLQYDVAPGNNDTDFWYTIQPQRGRRPYFTLGDVSNLQKVYFETEFISFTTTYTGGNAAYFMAWKDSSNYVGIYTHGDGALHATKVENNAWNFYTGLSLSLPCKVRIIWDRVTRVVSYQYWTGSAWAQLVADQTVAFDFSQVSWYLKCWNSGITACSKWGYVKLEGDGIYHQIDDPAVKTSAEEVLRLPPVGGPTGRGVRLPSTSDIDPIGFGTKTLPIAAAEENARFKENIALFTTKTGAPRNEPRATLPVASAEEKAGLWIEDKAFNAGLSTPPRYLPPIATAEEKHVIQVMSGPALSPYVTDEDGKTLLGDQAVNDVFVYDTAGEPWATPSAGNGHYVYGRNGKAYYDGQEVGPTLNGTSFGTLAGGYNQLTWMTDVEPSALASWATDKMQMALIADDVIKIWSLVPQTNWDWSRWLSSRHRWYLTGDFDIEVSYANRNTSGGNDGCSPGIRVQVDENNWTFVRRHHDGGYDCGCMVNGGWVQGNSVYQPDSDGKLRITRTSKSYSVYYWGGTSWVTLMTTGSYDVHEKPVHVEIWVGGTGDFVISRVDVYGFVINSGTVINTAGWYREPSSATRGTRQDFPEKVIIVATKTSVDILDFLTQKLWMRFLVGANNALHTVAIEPRRAVMRNGIMLISYNTGGTVCVDFTTDDIRTHLVSAETWCGGILRSFNGVSWAPPGNSGREVGPLGIIASRNLGGGYSGDNDYWQIPSNTVYHTDLFEDASYLYKIHATAAGLGVTKWKRWHNDGVSPNNWWTPRYFHSAITDEIFWCYVNPSDGTLFYYAPATATLYIVTKSNWIDTALGGSVVADYVKSVPGSVVWNNFRPWAASTGLWVHEGYVYRAADEGLYRFLWPSGAWELYVGPVDGGAVIEALPANLLTVSALSFCEDDVATPLLLVDVIDQDMCSQTIAINPTSATVYAKGQKRFNRRSALLTAAVA